MTELNHKILVAYVDKYGYVSEIVDYMTKIISETSVNVDIVDLRRTRESKWPSLNDYTGIILISAGRTKLLSFWTGKARKFASLYVQPIEKEKLVGFFRSDPYEYGNLLDPIAHKEKFAKNILQVSNFIPDIYEDFGPVLDFSRKSELKRDDREILKDSAKRVAKATGIEFEYKGLNDFRDWNRIEEATKEFIEQLQKGKPCASCGSIVPLGDEFCNKCGSKM
jgi:menaquinone-dependent protoporphyrinogen IX oxidase